MVREMHKKNRQLSAEETETLFTAGHHGTLSMNGDDGYPYATPVNYVYVDHVIYLHSAKYGYKIEALQKDNRVCFSTILRSEIVQKQVTAKFESVIATGRAEFVTDEAEKRMALETFVYRLTPDELEIGMKFLNGALDKTELIKINVESITGKAYRGDGWNQ